MCVNINLLHSSLTLCKCCKHFVSEENRSLKTYEGIEGACGFYYESDILFNGISFVSLRHPLAVAIPFKNTLNINMYV